MDRNLTVVFTVLFCTTGYAQSNEAVKTQLIKEWQRAKAYTLEYVRPIKSSDIIIDRTRGIRLTRMNEEKVTAVFSNRASRELCAK